MALTKECPDNAAWFGNKTNLSICVALMGWVALLYMQTADFAFVSLDDYEYVLYNGMVSPGLTFHGIVSSFTQFYQSNWHPLTWISHMLDVSLFGMDPGRHHLMSVAIHAASTALLFLALRRMTGAVWRTEECLRSSHLRVNARENIISLDL